MNLLDKMGNRRQYSEDGPLRLLKIELVDLLHLCRKNVIFKEWKCAPTQGGPHASWLRQVESYLKDTGMTGLASAWAMARRRPKEYRHKVDAATRCSGVCPHT